MIDDYSKKDSVKEIDQLKALDKRVKMPAYVFAYTFGVIGALILGLGMCLAMNVIGGTIPLMIIGIAVGVIGLAMVSVNYFIFTKILASRKAKYAAEVIAQSQKLLND